MLQKLSERQDLPHVLQPVENLLVLVVQLNEDLGVNHGRLGLDHILAVFIFELNASFEIFESLLEPAVLLGSAPRRLAR